MAGAKPAGGVMSKASSSKSNGQTTKGRRFSTEQKEAARKLVATGVLPRTSIAAFMGTTPESIRRWMLEVEPKRKQEQPAVDASEVAKAASVAASTSTGAKAPAGSGGGSPYVPRDPGQGLGEHEVAAIVELKKKHPSMGPAQLRAQFKRFKGWRLSHKAIARVLKKQGYEPGIPRAGPKDRSPSASRRHGVGGGSRRSR